MSEVLFADDDAALRMMVSDALRAAGLTVRVVTSGDEALAEVRRAAPDLTILDYRMGTPDGLEVCRIIKTDPRLAHLPVMILTAQGTVEDRLRGFDAGADDYLPKPFDPRELVARVTALLRQARRGRDLNPTTGLPGGEAIQDEVERRLGLATPFAVCYFDLDHFKPFSDRFGFAVADAAIRAAGDAVVAAGEGAGGTFVGHVGGDDFVAVCDEAQATELARRARGEFAVRLRPHLPADVAAVGSYHALDRYGTEREFPLTRLSAAVVRIPPGRWTTLEALGARVAELKAEAKADANGVAEGEL